MKLYNKSNRIYQHSYLNDKKKVVILNLYPKQSADIPEDIAKLWLKSGEVVEYVDPAEAKKAEAEAAEKQAQLEDENAELKAEIKKLKEAAKKAAKK